MQGRTVDESRTEQVQILTFTEMNGYNRLRGGKLMDWVDEVAGVVARRHTGTNVTTAVIDNMQFIGPAKANELLSIRGYATYTGNTSMEVCVETYVEHMDGTERMINKAYVVMVAIDEDEKPTKVLPLILQTEAEQKEWELAAKRNEIRKQRRKEGF
ncbi:MAG: acyl-CoA thioesterase [Lachnospiraceae bacterium]|nr:acyl-CoA thioesterase [Lachnospiraceae bacterium]